MKLGDLIRKEAIRLDLEASDKWEAIEEAVNLLVANHDLKISDRDRILNSVVEREKSMSTGIGKGVGIPHATCDKLGHVLSVYARLKNPIDFESIDGQPVQHIVLMLIPKDQYQQHIKTLAGIARIMNNPEAREGLNQAASPEEILDVIQQAEMV